MKTYLTLYLSIKITIFTSILKLFKFRNWIESMFKWNELILLNYLATFEILTLLCLQILNSHSDVRKQKKLQHKLCERIWSTVVRIPLELTFKLRSDAFRTSSKLEQIRGNPDEWQPYPPSIPLSIPVELPEMFS